MTDAAADSMGKSLDEIRKIKEEFARQYRDGKVVRTTGITSVGIAAKYEPDFQLRPGEALEDLCLGVGVAALPATDLPSEYQGVRVHYYVAPRHIRAQSDVDAQNI